MTVTPEQGIAYGIVQGLTEFLPISSSGHLVLLTWFSGWSDPGLAFDVALHGGTLAAVLGYFWSEWWRLAAGLGRSLAAGELAANAEAALFWKLVVASIPGTVAGLVLEDVAATTFRSPLLIATTLAGFGLLLYWSDRRPSGDDDLWRIGWREAAVIGVAQAFAIVPGVSRSGVTITAARFVGMDRTASARFSFLLGAPMIAGAVLVAVPGAANEGRLEPGLLVGVLVAAVSGGLAIGGLLRYVQTRSYTPFVVYRLVLAGLILIVVSVG